MKIKDIEDLDAWQQARILLDRVYKLTDKFPAEEKYNFCKHMRACSRNIPANIAEAFGRFNFQESMQFYRIARGSLSELKSDVYCSFDRGYFSKEELETLNYQIRKVGMLLNGLIKSTIKVKKSPNTSNE